MCMLFFSINFCYHWLIYKCTLLTFCNFVQDRVRRLLTKPIKFFNEMQELFQNSSADGSLAMDANTCMNDTQDDEDNDYDDDICNDFSNYAQVRMI
jgi:hypothetical protein